MRMTSRSVVTLIGVAALAAGCASPVVSVGVKPVQAHALTDLAADSLVCERAAKGAETTYAACMIARGYRATVSLPTWSPIGRLGERPIFVEVGKEVLAEPAAITADLMQCRRSAIDQRTTMTKVLSVATGRYPGEGLRGYPIVRAYAACLEPRGYTIAVWTPDR